MTLSTDTSDLVLPSVADSEMGDIPIIAIDMPVMYEDEGQDELGEADHHYDTVAIFRFGVSAHLAGTKHRVFSDLNVYYHPIDQEAYVSPDGMVVTPTSDLRDTIASYKVGRDGPNPILTAEVLSKRSYQQQDLTTKLNVYAAMEVAEYYLIDTTGKFLEQRLLLKKRQEDGTWQDVVDADGCVSSRLGFRLRIDQDERLRVLDAKTGQPYARPDEAESERKAFQLELAKRERAESKLADAEQRRLAEAEARQLAEQKNRELQAELDRLHGQSDAAS